MRSEIIRFKSILFCITIVTLSAFLSHADTNVCGTISANTTWTATNSPYIATCDVTLQAGYTLTIEPAVTVKVASDKRINIGGKLMAVGTASNPILFTSNAVTPAPGNWRQIFFEYSASSLSQLAYVTVSYGGAGGYNTAIKVKDASPSFDHVTVSYSSFAGIEISGSSSSPSISNSTFTNNATYGLHLTSGTISPTGLTLSNNLHGIYMNAGTMTLTNSSITNNSDYAISTSANTNLLGLTGLTVTGNGGGTKNAIGYRVGYITTNETWRPGLDWVMLGEVFVNATGILTIQPTVKVKFISGAGLRVSGKLIAVGTASQPILFTSNAASPAPGNWKQIFFEYSTSSTSQIAYATISYGGAGGYNTIIKVKDASPSFDNITVSYSSFAAIEISGATSQPSITNSTFTNNATYGIHLTSGTISPTGLTLSNNVNGVYLNSGTITLTNSAITNNSDYAISTSANTNLLGLTGLTVTGNGGGTKNAIGYRVGYITTNETWRPGLDWVMLGEIFVNATGILTIQPTVKVKFISGAGLRISGKLIAVGTASQPILFTSNAASPAPGNWKQIFFEYSTSSTSQIAYATISYGGAGGYNTVIKVKDASPTFDNITVSYSSFAGMEVSGSSSQPTITNSTFANNTTNGIYVTSGAVNLSSSSLINNTDYAISAGIGTNLLGLTGLTVTGNGGGNKNGVGYRAGTLMTTETWRPGITWIVTNYVSVHNYATLTIQPGVTVKFVSNAYLTTLGRITAVGTSAQPIVFTSNSASPAPGNWKGINLEYAESSVSQFAYATVSYAGADWGAAIRLGTTSASFDHITITYSSGKAFLVSGTSNPTITNCAFTNVVNGIVNSTPTNIITAKLNYWNASSGPSGSGSGTGYSVSTGVIFEPWLMVTPSHPNFVNTVTILNRTFNPNIGTGLTVSFGTTLSGNWTVKIMDNGSNVIRTYTGSGATANVTWDGKNQSGVVQPNGTYRYQIESTSGSDIASNAQGLSLIDTTKVLAISNYTASNAYFSPNADTIQDTSTVSASFNFDDPNWTINVRNSVNTIVRTANGQGQSFVYVWDGKNGSQVVQPDGLYTFELIVTAGTDSESGTKTTTLDNTLPASVITSPASGVLVSNVYQSGSSNVVVVGTANDLNVNNWKLQWGAGASPSTWTDISTGTVNVVASTLGTWTSGVNSNGLYTLKVQVWDKAGNTNQWSHSITLGNFKVSQNVLEFKGSLSQTVTYSSIIPFTLTETLVIKNQQGQIVRTLVSTQRPAGTYNDAWNGRNDSNVLLPDGPYFYIASVTDGTSAMTWDLTNQYLGGGVGGIALNPPPYYDPFDNQPFSFTYNLPAPYQVSYFVYECDMCPNYFYIMVGEYQSSGTHSGTWAGTDATGKYRPDMHYFHIATQQQYFSKNAVVLYGTLPAITNLAVNPPFYRPGGNNQNVTFNLTTYQSQPANITVTYLNQDTLSVVRTITQNGVSPGSITIPWDGNANQGITVAPGNYTITVTVNDSVGNQIKSQILSTIQY